MRRNSIVYLRKRFRTEGFSQLAWPRLVLLAPLLLTVWYGVLMASVNAYASVSDLSPADAAIVMGAAVWGSRPSPVYAERIKHSIELYHSGQVRAIVFTGGLGRGDQLSEGEAGKEYAVARGVLAPVGFQLIPRVDSEVLLAHLGATPEKVFLFSRDNPAPVQLERGAFEPLGRMSLARLAVRRPDVRSHAAPEPAGAQLVNEPVGAFPLWGFKGKEEG